MVTSDTGFPIELVLLMFVLMGVVGVTVWLTRYLTSGSKKEAPFIKPPAPPTPPKLLTLHRTEAQQWEIMIGGTVCQDLNDVPDEATRQLIVQGLRHLAGFARAYLQAQKGEAPRQPAETRPPVEERLAAPRIQLTPTAPQATPNLLSNLQRFAEQPARSAPMEQDKLRVPDLPPELMPRIDLAREIGEIVGQMQGLSPNLASRSIRLQNAPNGGIYFAIDGIVHKDVESIPDPEIQALIRAATKEWERR